MALAFYSTATGRLRRIVNNSAGENQSNRALENTHPAFTGETRIRVRDNLGLDGVVAAVLTDSGITPANDRYAVIDSSGAVVNTLLADPLAGDSIPEHTLVASDTARIGWRITRAGQFQRTMAEIDEDIDTELRKRAFALSPTTSITQAEKDERIAAANVRLAELDIEQTARIAPR